VRKPRIIGPPTQRRKLPLLSITPNKTGCHCRFSFLASSQPDPIPLIQTSEGAWCIAGKASSRLSTPALTKLQCLCRNGGSTTSALAIGKSFTQGWVLVKSPTKESRGVLSKTPSSTAAMFWLRPLTLICLGHRSAHIACRFRSARHSKVLPFQHRHHKPQP
jgi:hypothetical protein